MVGAAMPLPLHNAKGGIAGGETGHCNVGRHWDLKKYMEEDWGIGHETGDKEASV